MLLGAQHHTILYILLQELQLNNLMQLSGKVARTPVTFSCNCK